MLNDSYKTLDSPTKGLYKSKGSKFFAFAYPIESDEQARKIIQQIKKEYYDARHHCFAYILGINKEYQRFNDDNEPSGTAGKPILGRINSLELTNTMVVVVRYFGGTLLGVSGLIKAYKEASTDALSKATFITKTINEQIAITCSYDEINIVMQLIKDENIVVTSQKFEIDCQLFISIRKSLVDTVRAKLKTLKTIKIDTIVN